MNLNSRKSLISRLMRGRKTRQQFVESHLIRGLAFQVRAMRDTAGWTQTQLADHAGTTQNGVYKLEAGVASPNLSTLRKIAAAFDVALVVRFVPFSELVDWVSGTPRVQRGLRTGAIDVPDFAHDDFSDAPDATQTGADTVMVQARTGHPVASLNAIRPEMLRMTIGGQTTDSYVAMEAGRG